VERIEALSEIEARLYEARRLVALLEEGAALRQLVRARTIAEQHADVPGSAAWLAEVELAIGITAAQAGLDSVSDAAFARAATLDGLRGLRAAEAAPSVVVRAQAIAQAVANRATGSFEISSDAPGTRVFFDDSVLGFAPLVVRAPVGTHLLRMEAPGRLSYGRVLEVQEGQRPSLRIRLAQDRVLSMVERVMADGAAARYDAALEALGPLETEGIAIAAIGWLEIGSRGFARALLTVCRREGCTPTQRLVLGEQRPALRVSGELRAAAAIKTDLPAHRVWLRARHGPPVSSRWYQHWAVWAFGAGLSAAALAALVALTGGEAEQQLEVVVDPNALLLP
jgi:hypothetical protein